VIKLKIFPGRVKATGYPFHLIFGKKNQYLNIVLSIGSILIPGLFSNNTKKKSGLPPIPKTGAGKYKTDLKAPDVLIYNRTPWNNASAFDLSIF
jgi:hypothetical protein